MTGENAAPAEMPGDLVRKVIEIVESAVNSAIPEPWEVSARASAAILSLFAPILAEKESLRRELHSLAVALHRKHYWHVKQWKPFDDALGLATQIDNMTAGLVPQARALAAEAALAAERERCAKIADDNADNDSRGDSPYDNGAGSCGYRKACYDIAAAIRAEGE